MREHNSGIILKADGFSLTSTHQYRGKFFIDHQTLYFILDIAQWDFHAHSSGEKWGVYSCLHIGAENVNPLYAVLQNRTPYSHTEMRCS